MRSLALFDSQVRAIDRIFDRAFKEFHMTPIEFGNRLVDHWRDTKEFGQSYLAGLVPEDGAVITQSRMVTDRLKVKHILDDDGNFIKAELIPIKETKEIPEASE
jgi:hypothetical protein